MFTQNVAFLQVSFIHFASPKLSTGSSASGTLRGNRLRWNLRNFSSNVVK